MMKKVMHKVSASASLAFMVWLRLQHTGNAKPVRPAFYGNNFFSLLSGESRTIHIAFSDKAASPDQVLLLVDGWNITRETFLADGAAALKKQTESRGGK
jgi:hypothetical protein